MKKLPNKLLATLLSLCLLVCVFSFSGCLIPWVPEPAPAAPKTPEVPNKQEAAVTAAPAPLAGLGLTPTYEGDGSGAYLADAWTDLSLEEGYFTFGFTVGVSEPTNVLFFFEWSPDAATTAATTPYLLVTDGDAIYNVLDDMDFITAEGRLLYGVSLTGTGVENAVGYLGSPFTGEQYAEETEEEFEFFFGSDITGEYTIKMHIVDISDWSVIETFSFLAVVEAE